MHILDKVSVGMKFGEMCDRIYYILLKKCIRCGVNYEDYFRNLCYRANKNDRINISYVCLRLVVYLRRMKAHTDWSNSVKYNSVVVMRIKAKSLIRKL